MHDHKLQYEITVIILNTLHYKYFSHKITTKLYFEHFTIQNYSKILSRTLYNTKLQLNIIILDSLEYKVTIKYNYFGHFTIQSYN